MGKGGVDWDELLSYETIKIVKIKNRCVGGMHYFFMFLIAMYLFMYVFLFQKKYLHMDEPSAQARLSSMGPCQPLTAAGLCTSALKQVMPAVGEKCRRNFQCDRHRYCAGPKDVPSTLKNGKFPCVYADHNTVTWPPSEKNAITLATRMSVYKQELKTPNGVPCGAAKGISQTSFDCQYSPSVSSGKSADGYIADIGNFTISLTHNVYGTVLPISASSQQMKGVLKRCRHGKKCRTDSPGDWEDLKVYADNSGTATFTIDDLLNAIVPATHEGTAPGKPGLNLDDTSPACPAKCRQYSTGKHLMSSNRWAGFVVILDVTYDNTGLIIPESSKSDVRYILKAYVVKGSTFRVEVPFLTQNHTREIHHLRGVRIITMTRGHLGMFSFNTILIQLTTSLTLLAIATAIVDVVITSCMRDRAYYKAAKYQDDEHAIRAAFAGAGDQGEMQALLEHHNEQGGLDYRALLTGGMLASEAPVVGVAVPAQGYGTKSPQQPPPPPQQHPEPSAVSSAAQPQPQPTATPQLPEQQRRDDGGCLPGCRPSRDRSGDQV